MPHSTPYKTDRMNREHWSRTLMEREQARRARRLVQGLEELWTAEADSEQALARALHEVIDSP